MLSNTALRRAIYIVTTGNYSDYRICAVFSAKKDAKSFCAEYRSLQPYSSEIRIERWLLYQNEQRPIIVEWYIIQTYIDRKTGEITSQHAFTHREVVNPPAPTRAERTTRYPNTAGLLLVRAPTKEQAEKAAQDWYYEVKAKIVGVA